MNRRKQVTALLVVLVVLAMAFASCQPAQTTAPKTEPPKTTKATPKLGDQVDRSGRVKVTMFSCNSGLAHPDGVNVNDNPWVNLIMDLADVQLDVTIPPYQDFNTQFTLMLGSGNLPDIVHSISTAAMSDPIKKGAFVELSDLYNKSAKIKKYITPLMMELAKDIGTGKNYRIPMAYDKGPQGSAVLARKDLIDKFNDGKWPTSVEGYLDVLRKIKADDPNNIPYTNRNVASTAQIAYSGTPIFFWHGAMPNGMRYDFSANKFVSTFLLPEYKAAVKMMRDMYDEGILDKEYATVTTQQWSVRIDTRNPLLMVNSMDQIAPWVQATGYQNALKEQDKDPTRKDRYTLPCPNLTTYPASLADKAYVSQYMGTPISGHGLYVSSDSKHKEEAFRVIEAYASDELWDAVFWGEEGKQHKIENGKKTPIIEGMTDPNFRYVLQYALIAGFVDGQEIKNAMAKAVLPEERFAAIRDGIGAVDTSARANGMSPGSRLDRSDEYKKKSAEIAEFIYAATNEAIMSKISMDEFDKRVAEYQKNYAKYDDEATKYINDNKEDLVKKGLNFNKPTA